MYELLSHHALHKGPMEQRREKKINGGCPLLTRAYNTHFVKNANPSSYLAGGVNNIININDIRQDHESGNAKEQFSSGTDHVGPLVWLAGVLDK